MSCSRYFGPTQSKYLTQGFYTEMSLEGFQAGGPPLGRKGCQHSSMWWIVSLALSAPSFMVLVLRPPQPCSHTPVQLFPEVSQLSCSSVDSLQPSTSVFLCPGYAFLFPHSRDFKTFSEDHHHPAPRPLRSLLGLPRQREDSFSRPQWSCLKFMSLYSSL